MISKRKRNSRKSFLSMHDGDAVPENQSVGDLAENDSSSDNQAANDDENEPPINNVMDIMEVDECQREIQGTSQDNMVEAEVQDAAATDDEIEPPSM